VSEAFARALAAWPRVRTMDSPGGWLYRVALNQARSWLRRRGLERGTGELEDIGADGRAAVEEEAAGLTRWFAGTRVLPRFPSPLAPPNR
jgi:DNA-directed RNA polymerase specialized sigma24 family protein